RPRSCGTTARASPRWRLAAEARVNARVLAGLLFALTALPAAAAAQGEPSVELTEAAIVERDARVEVWVRLSRAARYQSELMDGPYRLVLDFEDTAYRWGKNAVPVAARPGRPPRRSQDP